MGDAGRIRQILLNLVDNAVKFTERGQVVVAVECLQSDAQQARVRITVRDTGPGISDEDRARLFQRFSRLDTSNTRKVGGTGLGLAISQKLAELMGGNLDMHSTPGEGSTFWLELPLSLAGASESEFAETVEPAEGNTAQYSSRVLVVEDNLVNQKVAALMLGRLGCQVDVAADGRRAVEMFADSAYDLVFMDCLMPVMDGFEATNAIRQLEGSKAGRTPIVAMTANAKAGDREECLAAGMSDYITKPIQQSELIRILEQYCPAASGAIAG